MFEIYGSYSELFGKTPRIRSTLWASEGYTDEWWERSFERLMEHMGDLAPRLSLCFGTKRLNNLCLSCKGKKEVIEQVI